MEPSAPTSTHLLGTTLAGRYRLDAVLGEGGMGVVFRAHHLLLARDIAVKVMHAELSGNPAFSRRFEQEARSVARLEHPNIVQVSECGTTEDGVQYMVMQLLEGHDLTRLLATPLPPARAVDLITQVFRALQHAHARDIIHRDLKPANIFVTRDHEGRELVKLVDFGLARMQAGGDARLTQAGVTMGSPCYMSPEQALGGGLDGRADLYSAGVIFYEMLAGRPPFEAEDIVQVLSMQVTATPPPLPPEIPASLVAIVDKLLAKERAYRFANAGDVLEALLVWQSPAAIKATSDTVPAPTVPRSRDDGERPATKIRSRRRGRSLALSFNSPLMVAGVLAAGLGGWMFWPDGHADARVASLSDTAAELAWTLWPGGPELAPEPSLAPPSIAPQMLDAQLRAIAEAPPSPETCARFRDLLETVARTPHPSFIDVLQHTSVPRDCPKLSDELADLRTRLRAAFPGRTALR